MAENRDIPFNITLLVLSPEKLRGLRQIQTLDDWAGNSDQFNPDGLFSIEIFGKVGDPMRSKRFSYIDIKLPIFHPIIYKALVDIKRLYAGILNGTEFVLWNQEIKDFERATPLTGKTGYAYFMSHWESIVFKKNDSDERDQNILLIEKYKAVATTTKIVVMPAGLRDMEISVDGRKENDEINTFYRKFISISNTISDAAARGNQDISNVSRMSLQFTFNALYDMIEDMIKGKKKLLLGKWASRRIFNGTRNVITAMDTSTPYLGAPGAIDINDTLLGLYQALKSIMPIARNLIKDGFLSKVFLSPNAPVTLVDKKTRKRVSKHLRSEYFDRWMTDEGIEKVITSFQEESLRNLPLEIEGCYLGLVYKGPDGTFKIIQDIDDVPGARSKLDVYPLTFCELLYIACYAKINTYPTITTRYPIAGIGSTVPTMIHVKTTVKSEVRRELSENWEPMDESHVAYEFPTNSAYFNSMAPHIIRLPGLTADFDGDTMSATSLYSDESISENKKFLGSRKAYVGTDGKFLATASSDTINYVLYNMTGD